MKKTILLLLFTVLSISLYAQEKYTIKKGDTLWDISGKFYEDNFKWPIIWKYNKTITNPDLIYPKDNLVIPIIIKDGEPIKLSSDSVFKLSGEKSDLGLEKTGFEANESYSSKRVFQENNKKKIKLNEFEIVLDELPKDKIIATQEGRDFVTTGNVLRISNKNSEFQIGDKIVFLENIKKIKRMHLLKVNGYGVIEKLDKDSAMVKIEKSFDSIGKGLYVMKKDYEDEITLPTEFREIRTKDTGKIVYLSNNAVTSGDGYRAVLNLGKKDGVKVGDIIGIDRITTEHGIKREIKLAEAQVIYTFDNYCTVKIISSLLEIENGDLAKLVKVGIY